VVFSVFMVETVDHDNDDDSVEVVVLSPLIYWLVDVWILSFIVVLKDDMVFVSVSISVVLDCVEVSNNDRESVDRDSVLVICLLVVDDVWLYSEVESCIRLVLDGSLVAVRVTVVVSISVDCIDDWVIDLAVIELLSR
jgi:hypothetical protein